MIELNLPFPPSTNNLFLNARGRGRVLSPEYRAWKNHAGQCIREQKPMPFVGRAFIHIDIDDRRQGDSDNRVKAVMDILVDHGILAGDSKKHVAGHTCRWASVDGCRVAVGPA